MLNQLRKLLRQNPAGPIRGLAFFVLFYLYLWLGVDPRLIYHSSKTIINFPAFFRGWAFFKEFISYPGGLVEYLSAFLSQFLYYSWAGALVITLLAWLIYICTDAFIKAINAPRLRCIRFIPPILLLIAYTQYTYHFVTTVALLTALVFVCLYTKTAPKNKLLRLVVFLVLSVILYYAAGGAYLLFAALCAIYELFFRRRRQTGLAYLLSALIIPYVEGVLIFDVSITRAFCDLLPFSPGILFYETCKRMITLIYVLYLFLPLTAIVFGLWRILGASAALPPDQTDAFEPNQDLSRDMKKGKKKQRSKSSKPGAAALLWYLRNDKVKRVIESLVLFSVAGTAVFFWRDDKLKASLEVNYYSCHRMWAQVLQAARRNPNNYFIVHAANRSLYHTGRLGYEMFAYHQHPDTLFLTSKKHIRIYWKEAGTYIDLGHMNLAENALAQSLERLGERPMILKRLALVNMVKGDIGAARIYLGALSKTLFHSQWANNYLHRLESDHNLSTDEEIQRLRCLMSEKNYAFTSPIKNEDILLDLLEKNRQNQMAFEYLMACYLLTSQLDKFVQNLDRLDDFEYSEIPRCYEEAILIYQVHTGKKVDLKGRKISRSSYRRVRDFSNICNRFQDGRKDWMMQAMRAAAKDFTDSYFFYYTFWPLRITK